MAKPPFRALELYCGIGGFSAAVDADSRFKIVAAIDQNEAALSTYKLNFPTHPSSSRNLEGISVSAISQYNANFWWLSPPCQPYTRRGKQMDLEDPRAKSFIHILDILKNLPLSSRPEIFTLENVAPFKDSRAYSLLFDTLNECGFSFTSERLLCPTELGIPSRRPRYYLVASQRPLQKPLPSVPQSIGLGSFLEGDIPSSVFLSPDTVKRFASGIRIIDQKTELDTAYTTCFTSGYGVSLQHSGAYLRVSDKEDGVRRFTPKEILNLLGFPPSYTLSPLLSLRKQWQLVGNSLSVFAVREMLRAI